MKARVTVFVMRSLQEVFEAKPFQSAAGIGLIVLGYLHWIGSSYSWVVTFFYLLIYLPGLYFYLRSKPSRASRERNDTIALEKSLKTFKALRERFMAHRPLLRADERQCDRAVEQFDRAERARRAFKVSAGASAKAKQDRLYWLIMNNLALADARLAELAEIDQRSMLRAIQHHEGRDELQERERKGLKTAHLNAEQRKILLSELIDALNANDPAVVALEKEVGVMP